MDYQKILISDPLYSEYNLKEFSFNEIMSLLYYSERYSGGAQIKTLDSFCTECSRPTTFISQETSEFNVSKLTLNAGYHSGGNGTVEKLIKEFQNIGIFMRIFECPRPESNSAHNHTVIFHLKDSKLIKIGQTPSIADISKSELEKYRKLPNNIYSELNRAVGLASHGVGVGSFVYLRRIIEKHLVIPAIEKAIEKQEINRTDIINLDFKGKIDISKKHLPDFLVENKKIYSVLSKGIHQLEEKECNHYFPILRTSIELILDEEIEKIEKEKKKKSIAQQITNIN